MSMDLLAVQDQSYYNDSINIEQVFTYANIVMPPRPNYVAGSSDTTVIDDITTDFASELTEMEKKRNKR